MDRKMNAGELREYINKKYFAPARKRGDERIEVRAGDIQKYNIPNVCSVMKRSKIEAKYHVKIVGIRDGDNRENEEARDGVSYRVTYKLLPNDPSQGIIVPIDEGSLNLLNTGGGPAVEAAGTVRVVPRQNGGHFQLQDPDEFLNDSGIDWIKVICNSTYWVSKEAFKIITEKNCALYSPGVFYPYCTRKQQTKKVVWKDIDGHHRYLDLNHKPQDAISQSLLGRSWGCVKGYTCCHIYGGEYINTVDTGWKGFTSVANIVLVPQPLKALTDHYAPVMEFFKYVSFKRYGFEPVGTDLVISNLELLDERYEEYVCMVKELPLFNGFQEVYLRKIKEYAEASNPVDDTEVAEWKSRVQENTNA